MNDLVMTGASPDEVWPLVRDFHYSRRMPSAIRHCFALRKPGGLFGETGEPQAGAIFGNPVQMHWNQAALELLRLVRKDECRASLSGLVGWALRWLKANTTTPFVLSYADTAEGHHGGIYQALNFHYVGERTVSISGFLLPDGSKKHPRQVNRELGSWSLPFVAERRPDWVPIKGEPKHLYIFPLRQKWTTIARRHGWENKPYPKPSAARLLDAPVPTGASEARTLGAAPTFAGAA